MVGFGARIEVLAATLVVAPTAVAPSPATSLPLYAGVAPGSEGWRQVKKTTVSPATGGRIIRNVTAPPSTTGSRSSTGGSAPTAG